MLADPAENGTVNLTVDVSAGPKVSVRFEGDPLPAARLKELDVRRADWNARVAAYRAERDALRAAGLPPERLAEALTRLRDSRFQGADRVRIEALEGAEADQAKSGKP